MRKSSLVLKLMNISILEMKVLTEERERERDLWTHEKIDSCTNEENLFFITDQMEDVIYEPSCHEAIICGSWNDEEINQPCVTRPEHQADPEIQLMK